MVRFIMHQIIPPTQNAAICKEVSFTTQNVLFEIVQQEFDYEDTQQPQ